MRVVDRINHDMGRGAIRIASASAFELTPGRTVAWKGQCEKLAVHFQGMVTLAMIQCCLRLLAEPLNRT